MKHLGVINPDQTCTYDFSVVEGLAKRFPQLGIADREPIDGLRDELMDFKLSPAEYPQVANYKQTTSWNEVSK